MKFNREEVSAQIKDYYRKDMERLKKSVEPLTDAYADYPSQTPEIRPAFSSSQGRTD